MNENKNSLSALSFVISTILTENLTTEELNLLGLLLETVGNMLQLNAWQISNNILNED